MRGNFLITWALLGAFTAFAAENNHKAVHKSLFSGIELSEECLDAYQSGVNRYQKALENSYRGEFEDLLMHKRADFEDCSTELMLGAFDARSMQTQLLSLELLLELDYTHNTLRLSSPAVIAEVQKDFETRFKSALADDKVVAYLIENINEFGETLENFKNSAFDLAAQEKKALAIGRFIFTPAKARKIRTLHNFVRDASGLRQTNADGEWTIVDGDFSTAVKAHWKMVTDLATEYLEWKPSRWFGEDSWIYGSIWRHYFGDREAPSIREIKESHYMDMMEWFIRIAENNYGIPTNSHREVFTVMLKKQTAYLDRDIATIKAVKVGYVGAMFVPVGIALGSAGLAYVGLSVPAGVSSFT
ncbi:hypothetical protein GW915_10630, partial [bacterium]|nr:hypothetical protein [bacterium]